MTDQQLSAYVLRLEGTHYLKLHLITDSDGASHIATSGSWDIRPATKFVYYSHAQAMASMCAQLLDGTIEICRTNYTASSHDPIGLYVIDSWQMQARQ